MTSAFSSPSERLRIIVLGYLVRCPLGGMAWHYLQYVLGLRQLGHDVYYLEDSDDADWCCYDPSRHVTDRDPTYGLAFARETFEKLGLADRWAYYDAHAERWHGLSQDRALRVAATAEAVVNVSGANPLRLWLQDIPLRIYVDTDPAFTQIRNLVDPQRRQRTAQHTALFSYGENMGQPACQVPDDGFSWRPTRQPVVLDAWPVTPGDPHAAFTTVMQWESDPVQVYAGAPYGQKSASFQDFFDLPSRTVGSLELAIGGAAAPRQQLERHGWRLRNPLDVTRHPWTYQRYLQTSKGEFSIAKQGYAVSQSGWFSERSAGYLASGRPVICQDTGFSRVLETGEGLLAFKTPIQARDALEAVNARYPMHCRTARELAEAFFDSRRVLTEMLETALHAPTPAAGA